VLFFFSITVEVSIIKRGINHFNSATFLCLYQTRTWISIDIYRVLFVFNDLWLGGNLLVLLMLMELLAIKCCLSFIFINQLHTIPVISLVCFLCRIPLYQTLSNASERSQRRNNKTITFPLLCRSNNSILWYEFFTIWIHTLTFKLVYIK
jgi:hypothetical protein